MGRWYVAHCPLVESKCKKTTSLICCVQNRAEAKKKLINHVTTGHYHMMPWSDAAAVADKHEHTAITVQDWTSDEERAVGGSPPRMTDVKQEHDESEVASESEVAMPAAKRHRSSSASANTEDVSASIRRAEMAIRHAANIARNAVLAFDAEADTLRNIRGIV